MMALELEAENVLVKALCRLDVRYVLQREPKSGLGWQKRIAPANCTSVPEEDRCC
jgi:hypothetical protein